MFCHVFSHPCSPLLPPLYLFIFFILYVWVAWRWPTMMLMKIFSIHHSMATTASATKSLLNKYNQKEHNGFSHRPSKGCLAGSNALAEAPVSTIGIASLFLSPSCSGMLHHSSGSLFNWVECCLITGKHKCFVVPNRLPWMMLHNKLRANHFLMNSKWLHVNAISGRAMWSRFYFQLQSPLPVSTTTVFILSTFVFLYVSLGIF